MVQITPTAERAQSHTECGASILFSHRSRALLSPSSGRRKAPDNMPTIVVNVTNYGRTRRGEGGGNEHTHRRDTVISIFFDDM